MTTRQLRKLIGTIEPAVYSTAQLEDYGGNPLVEALPPINSPREVVRYMSNKPRFSEMERELEPHVRLHCVMRLESFLHPLNRHVTLEQSLSVMIRRGYASRNPLTPNHARMMRHIALSIRDPEVAELEKKKFELPPSTTSARSIVGLSGIGKSTAVERIIMQYPQVILHDNERLKHTQVVWVKVDCPPDGSLRSLCLGFFQVFDELFGTHEAERLAPQKRATTDYLLGRMSLTAFNHSLGLLVIDEIQNLNQASSGGTEKMLNFFVELANTIGVPVLLIGTPGIEKAFQGELRDGRRFPVEPGWTRLMLGTRDWEQFLANLWRYQWTREYTPLTPEIEEVIFVESVGIPDLIVKLFALSQIRAMTSTKEKLDIGLIRKTAKESFHHLQPVLQAIRTGKELNKYPDVEEVVVLKNAVAQAFEEFTDGNSDKRGTNSEQEVVEWLMSVGHNQATAIRASHQTSTEELNEWKRAALKFADNMVEQASVSQGKSEQATDVSHGYTTSAKTGTIKKSSTRCETPLLDAVKNGKTDKMTPYQSLVKAGFVPDPVEFILSGDLRARTLPG